MKNSHYFPHDYHARLDPKLKALLQDKGLIGYGFYWLFVEILHEQGGKIEKFPRLLAGLASETKQNEATLEALLSDLISAYKLLKEDTTHIWSDRVIKNIELKNRKIMQHIEAGRLGGINSGKIRSKTKRRLKSLEANEPNKIKLNKTKTYNTYSEFVRLTTEEYEKLKTRFGEESTKQRIEALNDYLGSTGRHYPSHYHTILTWERRNENDNHKVVKMPTL